MFTVFSYLRFMGIALTLTVGVYLAFVKIRLI